MESLQWANEKLKTKALIGMNDLSDLQLITLLLFILLNLIISEPTNPFDLLPFPPKPPKYQMSFKISYSNEPGISRI